MSSDTDFNYGANAVQPTSDPSESRCMGQVKCNRCGKFHGYCAEIGETMLPTGKDTDNKGKKYQGGMDYLKNDDLNKDKKEAKILGVKATKTRFGPRVIVKIAFNGGTKFWSLNTDIENSPNYRLMIEKFGRDENDWIDKRVFLFLEQDEFSGNWFPRVDFPVEKKK